VALNAYIAQVRSLLNDAGAVEYTTPNLTIYINDARVQIASAAECIRFRGEFTTAIDQNAYPFTAIGGTGMPVGVQQAINARKMGVRGTSGEWAEVYGREWEWFWSYLLNGPLSAPGSEGQPSTFAVLAPGLNGTFYLGPIPNAVYVMQADCVGSPIALVDDSTVETLPYPWTEAVQYYAAYLALLNSQRYGDADSMLQRYDLFQTRATQMTTPTTLPGNYPGQGGAAVAGEARPITAPRGGQG
jgi:hypothetical protein